MNLYQCSLQNQPEPNPRRRLLPSRRYHHWQLKPEINLHHHRNLQNQGKPKWRHPLQAPRRIHPLRLQHDLQLQRESSLQRHYSHPLLQ